MTSPSDLKALLERVEAASGASGDLFADVAVALGVDDRPFWDTFSRFIAAGAWADAAQALVERALPGAVRVDLFIFAKSATAAIWPNEDDEYRKTAKTAPLALLAALLRALIAGGEG